MKTVIAVVLFLLACIAVQAQDSIVTTLPDAPKPQPHRFWDNQRKIAFATDVAIRASDTVTTCHMMSTVTWWRERWLPTNNCAGVAGFNAAAVAVETGISYIFHRTHHHKLERIAPLVSIAFGSAALFSNRHYFKYW